MAGGESGRSAEPSYGRGSRATILGQHGKVWVPGLSMRLLLSVALATFVGLAAAHGQVYPSRPVTMIEPVALLSSNPFLILAKKAMPADDLKGLIAWLKANPDKASQAIPTAGSHVAGTLFQKETGTRFAFVPYRGGGPAMQDLVAGQIDLMIIQAAVALPQVRAGAIKAYAVTASSRFPAAPDIPTVDEAV